MRPLTEEERREALMKLRFAIEVQAMVMRATGGPDDTILTLMMAAVSTAITHRKPQVTDEMIIAALHVTVDHARKIMPLLNELNAEAERQVAMREKPGHAQH